MTPKHELAELPPLRDALAAHGIFANKGFGQHFLLDLNVTRKIARLAGPLDACVTLEVGPGPGGLTRALLEAGARVVAVEKDPRFLPLLADLAAAAPGRLTVGRGRRPAGRRAGPGRRRGARRAGAHRRQPALQRRHPPPDQMADRPAPAAKHDPDVPKGGRPAGGGQDRIRTPMGRLAVIAQAVAEAEIVMDLPARAFTPAACKAASGRGPAWIPRAVHDRTDAESPRTPEAGHPRGLRPAPQDVDSRASRRPAARRSARPSGPIRKGRDQADVAGFPLALARAASGRSGLQGAATAIRPLHGDGEGGATGASQRALSRAAPRELMQLAALLTALAMAWPRKMGRGRRWRRRWPGSARVLRCRRTAFLNQGKQRAWT